VSASYHSRRALVLCDLAVLRAKALKLVFLHKQPCATEPWKTGIALDTPGQMRIQVPISIGQGSVG